MENSTRDFFWYNAAEFSLAINPNKPWQLCTKGLVCVISKFSSEPEARSVAEQLQRDKDLGILPNNLSKWRKRHLLTL